MLINVNNLRLKIIMARRIEVTGNEAQRAMTWLERGTSRIARIAALVLLATAATSVAVAGPFDRFDRMTCGQVQLPSEKKFRRVVRNFESNETLDIEGPSWNDTLLLDCKFRNVRGDAIRIRNVRNLTIQGCDIKNISGIGILLRSTGSTSNVTLINNRIENTGSDGIEAAKREADRIDHTGLVIAGNTIKTTGKRGRKGLQHAIYSQASDAVIVSNVIKSNREGNGISIRSSGYVACNQISGRSRTDKPGIRYYADHATGPTRRLVIRNNTITGSSVGIDIVAPPDGNGNRPAMLVRDFEITGNTSSSSRVVAIDEYWLDTTLFDITESNNKKTTK